MIDSKVLEEAKNMDIALQRPDVKSFNFRSITVVKDLKAFVSDLDDNMELELEYDVYDNDLDSCGLYYHCLVDKTEQELIREIKFRKELIAKNEAKALKLKEEQKERDLARILILEEELNLLKTKYNV